MQYFVAMLLAVTCAAANAQVATVGVYYGSPETTTNCVIHVLGPSVSMDGCDLSDGLYKPSIIQKTDVKTEATIVFEQHHVVPIPSSTGTMAIYATEDIRTNVTPLPTPLPKAPRRVACVIAITNAGVVVDHCDFSLAFSNASIKETDKATTLSFTQDIPQ